MNRSSTSTFVAILLAAYGLYAASFIPAMLVGPAEAGLLVGFVLQAVFALAAALGVWRGERWAAPAAIFLGLAVAGTSLYEAFVLGIIAYLRALLVSVSAVVVTFLIAAQVNRGRSS